MDFRPTKFSAFALVFVLLTIWTVGINLPFFGREGPDDAFYLEVAHLWARGHPPYVAAFDVKPPGFYALLAVVDALVGPNLATLRIVEILFTALAASALYFLAREFLGGAAAVVCALVYPIAFTVYGDTPYAPLCAATGLAFSAALSRKSLLERAALSGLAIGAAATIKQTAAFEALALMAILVSSADAAGRRATAVLAFTSAAALAPLAFLAYFAIVGGLAPLLDDVLVRAAARPSSAAEAISFWDGIPRALYLMIPLSPVTLAALFGLAAQRNSYALVPALALWLAAALAALLAQHAISPYYFTPTLAPMLLLAGVGLERLSGSAAARSRIAASVGFGVVAIVAVVLLRGRSVVAHALVPDDTALRGAKAAIEATSPRAGDRLYVASRGGLLYGATGQDPPMPYFEWSQTLCDFPQAGRSSLAGVLASAPRYIVVADRAEAYPCEQGSHWALIDEALEAAYRRVAEVEGPREAFQIYERR